MTNYTQPRQEKAKPKMTEGNPDGNVGHQTRGIDCVYCGKPGFEHEKRRVSTGDGMFKLEMRCPE